MKRYDERDALFSRMARKPDSENYRDYYANHPEKKSIDDALRTQPPMGNESARFYHPHFSNLVESTFHLLADLNTLCEGPVKNTHVQSGTPDEWTQRIQALAKLYGAFKIGIVPYSPSYYYTHKGRTDANYGKVIEDTLPYTIVFAVEMNLELFMQSPDVLESIAVTKGYLDAGVIGLILTYFIKQLGYDARNHMDGNYQMVLPLAAKEAGLGDIGRNGLLITPEHGARIRLGAVSTNLPLEITQTDAFSITAFCNVCKKCSRICPSQAIAKDERPVVTYENKWAIVHEKCYAKWQEFGSDCGLCIAKCPFSGALPEALLKAYTQGERSAEDLFQEWQTFMHQPYTVKSNDWKK